MCDKLCFLYKLAKYFICSLLMYAGLNERKASTSDLVSFNSFYLESTRKLLQDGDCDPICMQIAVDISRMIGYGFEVSVNISKFALDKISSFVRISRV